MTDLERWRLILGEPASRCTGGLQGDAARQDAALEWLYGRDPELAERGVRKGGGEDSVLQTVDWLDEVHRLFPRETIERLERDAVERYEITDVVTDPDVLQRIEPNPALLRAVLRTKHLMNPAVLAMARKIVEAVVRQLMEKLGTEVRQSFSGTRSRRPSIHRKLAQLRLPGHDPGEPAALPTGRAPAGDRARRSSSRAPNGTSSSGRSSCWWTSPGR